MHPFDATPGNLLNTNSSTTEVPAVSVTTPSLASRVLGHAVTLSQAPVESEQPHVVQLTYEGHIPHEEPDAKLSFRPMPPDPPEPRDLDELLAGSPRQ